MRHLRSQCFNIFSCFFSLDLGIHLPFAIFHISLHSDLFRELFSCRIEKSRLSGQDERGSPRPGARLPPSPRRIGRAPPREGAPSTAGSRAPSRPREKAPRYGSESVRPRSREATSGPRPRERAQFSQWFQYLRGAPDPFPTGRLPPESVKRHPAGSSSARSSRPFPGY